MTASTRRPTADGPRTASLGLSTHGRLVLPVLVALLPCILVPSAASPQEGADGEQERIDTPFEWIPNSFRIGLFGGYVEANRGGMELGPGPTETLGARARARISSPLSLEADLTYGTSDRFVIDPRLASGPAPVDTVTTDWILAQVAVQFSATGARTWHGIQPYVVVGAGFLFGINEEESIFAQPGLEQFQYQVNTAPTVQAGLGAEWLLSDRWGLGFEFRDHLWRIKAPDGFFEEEILDNIQDLGLRAPQESDWTHNLDLSITVWRYF